MAVYETFILANLSELKDGQEQILEIRDAETYVPKVVKAIVSRLQIGLLTELNSA